MRIYPELSGIFRLEAQELAVSHEQVARYAGGAGYRLDSVWERLAEDILELARGLAEPAFSYSVREVTGHFAGGHMVREDAAIPVPGEPDPGTKYLAFCVCTIGKRFDEAINTLMRGGDTLEGLFLDAAGVAFLEILSAEAYRGMRETARERLLHCGCRFVPGCGDLDLRVQKQLFELVDAHAIAVRLNEASMMVPAKSISFFTNWTTSKTPELSRNKCASCKLPHCPYRVQEVQKNRLRYVQLSYSTPGRRHSCTGKQ